VTSSRIAITLTACGLLAFTVNVHAQATTGPNTTTLDPPKIVAITGGKLLTITHGTIENGVVILENGKITAVGPASTKVPKDAQVFDAA
jgi:cytosine/adenosine deaminase-related metal-dependent hydrolase